MSLFDLLLAKALVEGLARADMPENFKVLRPNAASWRGLKEVCKKGNNVIAVEVTKEGNRRTQQAFLKLAREHDELTFFRAELDESGYTYPEVMWLHEQFSIYLRTNDVIILRCVHVQVLMLLF